MKTVIFYTFHQINNNVQRFFNKHIFDHEDYLFVIICNSLDINITNNNSNIIIINRENKGFDFGGWSIGIWKLKELGIYEIFDRFIFLNSSITLCIPNYYIGYWPDILINGIKDDIKIFGATINNYDVYGNNSGNSSHVQSFIFCLDKISLQLCIDNNIFSNTLFETDKISLVVNKEIGMSQLILKNGYNIGCLMQYYKDLDFRNKTLSFDFLGDPMSKSIYSKLNLHPYEIIFIKTNRDISSEKYKFYIN